MTAALFQRAGIYYAHHQTGAVSCKDFLAIPPSCEKDRPIDFGCLDKRDKFGLLYMDLGVRGRATPLIRTLNRVISSRSSRTAYHRRHMNWLRRGSPYLTYFCLSSIHLAFAELTAVSNSSRASMSYALASPSRAGVATVRRHRRRRILLVGPLLQMDLYPAWPPMNATCPTLCTQHNVPCCSFS